MRGLRGRITVSGRRSVMRHGTCPINVFCFDRDCSGKLLSSGVSTLGPVGNQDFHQQLKIVLWLGDGRFQVISGPVTIFYSMTEKT